MQFIKLLKKYIIDSQIYVSLMGTFFAVFFMQEQNTFRFPTIALIFITYFCGYLYTKYQYSNIFRKIIIINILTGIVCAVLIIHNHNINRLYKWLIIVILGLLYNSFFLENYIRKIPFLKIFYVGLVWGLVNSWLSFPEFNAPVFWISFLFVTALVLPFDIRDMKSDDVITFPKLIGVQNTKYLAYILVFASLMISVFYLKSEFFLSFFITAIFTFILIYFSENHNQDSYFSFWVENCSGLPLFFFILNLLINWL